MVSSLKKGKYMADAHSLPSHCNEGQALGRRNAENHPRTVRQRARHRGCVGVINPFSDTVLPRAPMIPAGTAQRSYSIPALMTGCSIQLSMTGRQLERDLTACPIHP